MANILFLELNLNPSQGGVERTTWTLAKYLEKQHSIFFCYLQEDWAFIENFKKLHLDITKQSMETILCCLRNFIEKNHIDVIINQGVDNKFIIHILSILKKAYGFKLISAIHVNPNYYRYRNTQLSLKAKVKKHIKQIFTRKDSNRIGYYKLFHLSEKTVLLSESFFTDFLKNYYLQESDRKKLLAIANALSFDSVPHPFLEKKEKTVLIISRFVDFEKNISAALRIWKIIEESSESEWKLILGGYGPDADLYTKLARELNLKRIEFVGPVSVPQELYAKASLFLFTSNIEGFGLTLTEAMQYGTVPVAFNTYSSINDIIDSNVNGILVPPGEENIMAKELLGLIQDEEKRLRYSENAIKKVRTFSIDIIGPKWAALIRELIEKK